MDFAPEPVRDAFPLPPTRSAPTAPADESGRSFDDHLEAVNEPPERPTTPQTEARDEHAAPAQVRSTESETPSEDDIDPEVALLGGPLPSTPPPQQMPAPIAIQIAAAQPEQTLPAPAQPDDAQLTPLSGQHPAPPTVQPEEPQHPVTPPAVASDKTDDAKPTTSELKDVSAKAPQTSETPQTIPDQTEAEGTATAAQPAPRAQTSPDALPPAVQQAIAATMTPTQTQPATQTTTRLKDAATAIDAKTPAAPRDGKPDAPAPTTKAPSNAAKSPENGKIVAETIPASQTQNTAPDAANAGDNSAITTTASQASTHVQHASAETGAQRAAPAAAQVGREVIRRFNGGATNFELRLDPADLGRVEVKLEVTRDNKVTAVITADNPQALTELARGARDLEQQLQSAGLQLSENGLSFDLRQGSQGGDSDHRSNSSAHGESNAGAGNEQQQAPVARPIGYERWRGVRVDMMV